MSNKIELRIGNTYTRLPSEEAPWTKSMARTKPDKWAVYADVITGNPDWIQHVTFKFKIKPKMLKCHQPKKIMKKNSKDKVWRFSVCQKTYGDSPGTAHIIIKYWNGFSRIYAHPVSFGKGSNFVSGTVTQFLKNPKADFKPVKIPDKKFGVELELTSSTFDTRDEVIRAIEARAGGVTVENIDSYSLGKETSRNWKLVPDSSILCNRNIPNCNKFELVSPILSGGLGLRQCDYVLKGLENVGSIKVNKSMGFHVHVNVEGLPLDALIKVCQNFLVYEDVVDTFMPPSRRSGSHESDSYCKSNKKAICGNGSKLTQAHLNILKSCQSMEELADCMNPGRDRYFKLNLQNVSFGSKPTLEFRQHSATSSSEKVTMWVRFCLWFVHNSMHSTPRVVRGPLYKQVESLFQDVVKDRYLQKFYRKRQNDILKEMRRKSDEPCCSGCATGNGCSAQKKRRRRR